SSAVPGNGHSSPRQAVHPRMSKKMAFFNGLLGCFGYKMRNAGIRGAICSLSLLFVTRQFRAIVYLFSNSLKRPMPINGFHCRLINDSRPGKTGELSPATHY
ncbi:MAG TPA: hypothetical protein VGY98_04910, partial [Verrucomicrobiae bacterium]|nr:hypothetical protein [Verrucomicrobiae bacterium]